jgi:hypothetical protein
VDILKKKPNTWVSLKNVIRTGWMNECPPLFFSDDIFQFSDVASCLASQDRFLALNGDRFIEHV